MNSRIDRGMDGSDDFERQLSQLGIVEPSTDYPKLAEQIRSGMVQPWWQNRKVLSAAAVVCTVVIVLGFSRAFVNQGQAPTQSMDTAQIFPPAGQEGRLQGTTANTETEPATDQVYESGFHYTELSTPVDITDPTALEAVVFFWYPCNPCYEFNDYLVNWEPDLPDNVRLTQIPAIWSDITALHARVYYTAEVLGVLNDVHGQLYRAMHEQGQELNDEESLIRFFNGVGVSASEFLAAFNSEETQFRVRVAQLANQDYQVTATPTLFIGGKYRITPNIDGGYQEMLRVADYLIGENPPRFQ